MKYEKERRRIWKQKCRTLLNSYSSTVLDNAVWMDIFCVCRHWHNTWFTECCECTSHLKEMNAEFFLFTLKATNFLSGIAGICVNTLGRFPILYSIGPLLESYTCLLYSRTTVRQINRLCSVGLDLLQNALDKPSTSTLRWMTFRLRLFGLTFCSLILCACGEAVYDRY
jgi:hypothetical protein